MFTVKKETYNKDDLLVITTETTMTFFKNNVHTFYNVRKDGVWYRIHNDRLETAIDFLNGVEISEHTSLYIVEMKESSLDWFLTHTLPKAV
jgi:hypothetical protein